MSPENKLEVKSESSKNQAESDGSFIKNLNLSIDLSSLSKRDDEMVEIEEIDMNDHESFETPTKHLVSPATADVK